MLVFLKCNIFSNNLCDCFGVHEAEIFSSQDVPIGQNKLNQKSFLSSRNKHYLPWNVSLYKLHFLCSGFSSIMQGVGAGKGEVKAS